MIVELLKPGRENITSTDELLEVLQIRPRNLYKAIREERRAGAAILSTKENGGGYWLWDGKNYKELEQYYKMQRSMAIDILATLKPVRKRLKAHEKGVE